MRARKELVRMAPDLGAAVRAAGEAARTHVEMIAQDKRISKALAKYLKRLFDDLVAEGFTEEQALKIAAHAPIPGMR
jgi:hypothetical protein